jgi:hypothetical protein
LTLTNVQPGQAGTYLVIVSNALGAVTSSNAVLAVVPAAPCATPPAGLVSWWPGEGTANDIAGTNSGTLVNGVAFAPGKVGQAFSFDGTSSYIRVPDNPSLHFTNAMTIEVWVSPSRLGAYQGVIGKWGWPGAGVQDYLVGVWPTGVIAFCTCPAGDCWQPSNVVSTSSLPVNQWTHFAVTYDGSTFKLYFNGVCETQTPYTGGIFPGTGDLTLGASVVSGGEVLYPFAGLIDEPAVYNRALSAAEIQAIYNAGSAGKCAVPVITSQPQGRTATVGSTVTFVVTAGGSLQLSYQWQFNSTNIAGATASSLTLTNVQPGQAGTYLVIVSNALGAVTSSNAVLAVVPAAPCATPHAGLVSWWPGEGTANDIANTNSGTLVNGVAFAPGKVGQAFSFGGTSSYIRVPDNPSLHFTNAMTIEAWIYPTSLGAYQNIVSKWDWPGANAQKAYTASLLPGGQANFTVCNDGSCAQWPGASCYVSGTSSLPVNQWTHFAGTYDGSYLSVYVNGVFENREAYTSGIFPGTNDLVIGAALGGFTPVSPFGGLIDEPAVYNRALSAAEIRAIYNAGSAGKCVPPPICIPPRVATASAVLAYDFVVYANMTDGGYGYTNTPTVRIIGGGGSGAQAVAVVSNGVVIAVNVLDAGYGYTNTPLVVIDPPFIPNPVLGIAPMSFLAFSNLTVGGVYQLQQLVAWYWSNQPVSFTATNALCTEMVAGVAGSGEYRLALNPVPAQAFATAVVNYGFVVHAALTSGGSGYVTSPAVSIVGGGGSNATAVSHISGGVVTGITISDAGIGYTNAPTVRIAPPPAAAMFPTVEPVMRVDSANLAPYNNYQIQFKPDLGGTWGNWNDGLFSPTDMTNSQYLFITNGAGFFRLQYVP